MITKNEERCLARCLESIKNIVDEIIIVDTGSEDNTKSIALSYGAKIYDFEWINDFSAARNYAIEKSTGDWNLILDADEYLAYGGREVLEKFMSEDLKIGKINQINAFNKGNEICYSKTFVSRFIPRGTKFVGKIHEQIKSKYSRVIMDFGVDHDGYLYVDKSERNLQILKQELKEKPQDAYTLYQMGHTLFVSEKYKEAEKYFEEFYRCSKKDDNFRCSGIVDYIYTVLKRRNLEIGLKIIQDEEIMFQERTDFQFVCGLFYTDLVLSDVQKYIRYLDKIEESYINCLNIGEKNQHDGVIGTGSFAAAYNLGIWYETSKQIDKAKICYEMASEWGYELAQKRLVALNKGQE